MNNKIRCAEIDNILTKEFLIENIVKNRMSRRDLIKKTGLSSSAIQRRISKLGIKFNQDHLDLTGKRVGKLLVLEKTNKRKCKEVLWKCRCDCGKIVYIMASNIRSNNSKSCGCVRHNKQSESFSWKGYKEISGAYYCILKSNAGKKGLEFSISIEYIWSLFEKQNRKCALSGIDLCFRPSCALSTNQTASLDRIDSSKGYVEGNVQWIHKDINWMKNDFKQEDFINYCKLIARNN